MSYVLVIVFSSAYGLAAQTVPQVDKISCELAATSLMLDHNKRKGSFHIDLDTYCVQKIAD